MHKPSKTPPDQFHRKTNHHDSLSLMRAFSPAGNTFPQSRALSKQRQAPMQMRGRVRPQKAHRHRLVACSNCLRTYLTQRRHLLPLTVQHRELHDAAWSPLVSSPETWRETRLLEGLTTLRSLNFLDVSPFLVIVSP